MRHSRYEVGIQIHSHLVTMSFLVAASANMSAAYMADYEFLICFISISSSLLALQILLLLLDDVIIY